MVLEYNVAFPPPEQKTIQYEPNFMRQHTDYFGASLSALESLARRRGYSLVYCDVRGINAFFVRQDIIPEFAARPVEEVFCEPDYARGKFWGLGKLYWPKGTGHRPDHRRKMVDVE